VNTFIQFYIVILILLGAPTNTLVSREHGLPRWYSGGEKGEARVALDALIEGLGMPVQVSSGFRSYRLQEEAYARLISEEGEERANQVIAQPGHSEHQLGTAFDLAWMGLPIEFNDVRNRQLWAALEERAHEFGFVISFPYKQINEWPFNNSWYPVVTEFRWEPWHIRYVGVELATIIYDVGYLDPQSSVLPQDFYEPWP
jgi:D-alanyl-D-alanine carboxypeptidase